MCSEFLARNTQTTNNDSFADHLFLFEEARRAFQKLSCTVFIDENETFLSFLALFDVVMTGKFDSFQCILQNSKQNARYVAKFQQGSHRESQQFRDKKKSYAYYGKGCGTPHKCGTSQGTLFECWSSALRRVSFIFLTKTIVSLDLL